MSLKIKNQEAHRLAQQLARVTGESMTEAVTTAIKDRLNRFKGKQGTSLRDRLILIGQDCATHLTDRYLIVDHGELLYDEKGLPR